MTIRTIYYSLIYLRNCDKHKEVKKQKLTVFRKII